MMMMAHDSGPQSPQDLETRTIASLRAALAGYVRHGTDDDGLRTALAEAAREAREKGIYPEQLLVRLKEIWYHVAGSDGATDPASRAQMLQRVVSICIRNYYE